eukprot:TRINITY_DN6473_c0_g1_i1.p1 TRINITY_DN6473_c0_g1~~TRINITY_DN6473_c0_g1_i1.p1  ORF type:complete len:540 (+),score=142.12 TRINITY_DN6473_c0_g1_i1:276-1895(+)
MAENEMQIHPEAIEPFVPIGKKVRKGENRRRRKNQRTKRSSRTRPTPTTSKRSESALGYAAATLAANIGKRLVVLHPTKEDREGVVEKEEVDDEVTQNQLRLSRLKAQNKRLSSSTVFAKYTGNNLRYRRKGNPDRFSLAASVTSLSKSFEKLDVVVAAARKRTKRKSTTEAPKDSKQSKSKRKTSSPKEITLAKIGRFKFTIESENSEGKTRKISKQQQSSSQQRLDPKILSAKQQRRSKNEDVAAYIRSLSLDNTSRENAGTPPPPIFEEETPVVNPSKDEVIVSKKPHADRPLAKRDYRLDLNAANTKFTRSISQPGNGSNAMDASGPSSAPAKQRHFSFMADNPSVKYASSHNLAHKKRDDGAPAQRSRRLGVVHRDALLLNIETANVFDNPGYDAGDNKLSKLSSSLKKQLSGTHASSKGANNLYESIKNDEDGTSSTSGSLSDISGKQRLSSPPTQVQSLSEESSSSMEDEAGRQKVKRKRSISRQRILETCIANEEAEKQLRSALETASQKQDDAQKKTCHDPSSSHPPRAS